MIKGKQYKGKIPYPQADGTTVQEENTTFRLALKYLGEITPSKKAPHRKRHLFKDESAGVSFTMMPAEFEALKAFGPAPAVGFTLDGFFTFVKRGEVFGITLVQLHTFNVINTASQTNVPSFVAVASAPAPQTRLKNHFVVCIDSSASMQMIPKPAVVQAINTVLQSIKDQAQKYGQDSRVSVWSFGSNSYSGPKVHQLFTGDAKNLTLMTTDTYQNNGVDTPLFQCLGEVIEAARNNDPEESQFVYMITDGDENASHGRLNPTTVNAMIKQVQATDRWTFAIQMPTRSVAGFAARYGVPAGNLQGWEISTEGVKVASLSTSQGIGNYYKSRSVGIRSVKNVYTTNLASVKLEDVRVKCQMIISPKFWRVDKEIAIKEFVEGHTKQPYVIGSGWYQLTKPEVVQPYKQIALRHKTTRETFIGPAVRGLIGINPNDKTTMKVVPGNHSEWDILITSTSVNRKLVRGTDVLFLVPSQPMSETWDSESARIAAEAKKAQAAAAAKT